MPNTRLATPRTLLPVRWHLGCLAWVIASAVWAQTPAPAQSPEAAASSAAPAASAASAPAVPAPPVVPKYSASDIKTIFGYLDRNKDGKISREEAAGFKGVARNFDRADTDHDGSLSFEEFAFAMNRAQ